MLTAKIPERQTMHMLLGASEYVAFRIHSIPDFIFLLGDGGNLYTQISPLLYLVNIVISLYVFDLNSLVSLEISQIMT
jgi:hypothetical protein